MCSVHLHVDIIRSDKVVDLRAIRIGSFIAKSSLRNVRNVNINAIRGDCNTFLVDNVFFYYLCTYKPKTSCRNRQTS